jgi:hypothetical protein
VIAGTSFAGMFVSQLYESWIVGVSILAAALIGFLLIATSFNSSSGLSVPGPARNAAQVGDSSRII